MDNRPGDSDAVDETTGRCERLSAPERETLLREARAPLERMIAVTRAAS